MPRHYFISQILVYTAQNFSSRRDGRKQLPQALLSRSWFSVALPHHIQYNRQLSRPLSQEVWTRDSDQPQIREETESPHLMNYRNKLLPSPLKSYEYGSEIFPFSSQHNQIHNRCTLQSPNNWSCIWEVCLLFQASLSTCGPCCSLLLLLPPSQRAGSEAGLLPPIPLSYIKTDGRGTWNREQTQMSDEFSKRRQKKIIKPTTLTLEAARNA